MLKYGRSSHMYNAASVKLWMIRKRHPGFSSEQSRQELQNLIRQLMTLLKYFLFKNFRNLSCPDCHYYIRIVITTCNLVHELLRHVVRLNWLSMFLTQRVRSCISLCWKARMRIHAKLQTAHYSCKTECMYISRIRDS